MLCSCFSPKTLDGAEATVETKDGIPQPAAYDRVPLDEKVNLLDARAVTPRQVGYSKSNSTFSNAKPTKGISFTNRHLNGTSSGAQEDNLGWLNYILSSLWPKFRAAGNKMGKEIAMNAITEMINEQKEQSRLDIDVTCEIDLDLGENPPVFAACRTYHTGQVDSETEGVEVDLAMSFRPKDSWNFSCKVVGKISHIPVNCDAGVNYFEVSGVASVVLTPLLEVFPVFGGGQIFFLDTPNVNMQFSGMADLGALGPLVMTTLRNAVVKSLQSEFVLPNSRFIPLRNIPLNTRVDLTSPLPEGVMQVTVHAAKGLKASDFSFMGSRTSDPLVEVQIGSTKFVTRAINKNLNPVWDPPEFGYLFVHNPNQALNVEVFDADVVTEKDFLAYLDGQCCIDVLEYKPNDSWPKWFPLVPVPPGPGEKQLAPEEEHPEVKLTVEYLEVCDLPDDHLTVLDRKVSAGLDKGRSHKFGGPRFLDIDHVTLIRVCSVKLLGMDCSEEYESQLWHAVALVTVTPGAAPWSEGRRTSVVEPSTNVDSVNGSSPGSDPSGKASASSMPASWLAKMSRGLMSLRCGGSDSSSVGETRKSHKAILWGARGGPVGAKGAGLPNISPQVQMMIERLHLQKHMGLEEIAEIANLSVEQVRLLVELRREFKVVWHQAMHFQMEYPVFTVDIEVKTVDGSSLGKVPQISIPKNLGMETSLRRREKLPGNESIPDVTLEFEVEVRGLQRATMQFPEGATRRDHRNYFAQHHTEHTAIQIVG